MTTKKSDQPWIWPHSLDKGPPTLNFQDNCNQCDSWLPGNLNLNNIDNDDDDNNSDMQSLVWSLQVHGAFAGYSGITVGVCNTHYVYLPIPEVITSPRRVNPDSRMWHRCLTSTGQPDFLWNTLLSLSSILLFLSPFLILNFGEAIQY